MGRDDTGETRGTRFLRDKGAAFHLVEYVYQRKGAGRAADAVGWPDEKVVKTLVVRSGPREFLFLLVPAHRDLSTRKLARVLGVKEVAMADLRDAERLTGYVAGGISPFGAWTALPVVLEQTLLEHDEVLINAGRRGVLVAMNPWAIQELLDARIEDVVT